MARGLPSPSRRGWLAATLALAALAAVLPALAQPMATEADLKAAYLIRFLDYVEWPVDAAVAPDAPLVIGVAGDEAVHAALLAASAAQREPRRALRVRRLAEGEAVDDVRVVFLGRAANPSRWLPRLEGRPVLLVTDHPRGLESGAMLNFVAVDGRIRFEASLARAQQAGLRLGARLLSVAERVVMP